MNIQEYLSKILSLYIKFHSYLIGLFLFISILMILEFLLQQVKIRSIKNEVENLQGEVIELKAELYDKSKEQDDEDDDEEKK